MTERKPCATHTKCPAGYLARHEWAERMMRTHTQKRCGDCGLWAVWVRKGER